MFVLPECNFFRKKQKKRLRVTKLVVLLQPHSETNDVEWCNGSTADFGSACQGSNEVEEKTCYFE